MLRLFVLLVYVFVAALMIAVILFQKTETGMGMGGTSNNFSTARGTGNLLTRLTGILATIFLLMSMWLAYLSKREVNASKVITSLAAEKTFDASSKPLPQGTKDATPPQG